MLVSAQRLLVFGPIRGLLYGGSDYAKHADNEILKLAMIETKEALEKLDEILDTPYLDVFIRPARFKFGLGEEPGFDKPEDTQAYKEILRILVFKKEFIYWIHNGQLSMQK